jgi:hypothetical protein
MARGSWNEARQSFFVEHYLPGRIVEQLTQAAERLRATLAEMQADGLPVAYVRSTIVPADEAFVCVIEAASEELVRDAYARAGISFDRISAAISPDDERSKAP